MPWSQTTPMHQRTLFISDHLRGTRSVAELCTEYGISRKTAYKWIDRFIRRGPAGLEDRSRRPRNAPNATDPAVVEALVALRHRHPTWGGRKLIAYLGKRHPHWKLPGLSVTCALLKRRGLVRHKTTRRKIGHPGRPPLVIESPNHVWCADFKGQFRMGNGRYCYPLTVTDGYSRFLLECRGLNDTSVSGARPVFQRLFEKYGLPQYIRTDNGVPFATNTLARLSRLSAWWVRMGVMPQLIEPGNPQQNGRHERMHRTLKAEATRPPEPTFARQQQRFERWRHTFNHERPHASLADARPADVYQPSPRPLPRRVPPLAYPAHVDVRRVDPGGGIKWRGTRIFLARVLAHEEVALDETAEGEWTLHFGPLTLGTYSATLLAFTEQLAWAPTPW